ncbi:MAG: hypothetical protein IJP13_01885 [Lachnospiraceae bacterium]|nr:hypothetical protein [Lachnospiraceae bacterium]
MSESEAEEDVDIDIPFAPGVDDESASEDPTIAGDEEEEDVPLGVIEDDENDGEPEEDVDMDIPFANGTDSGDKAGNKMWLWSAVSAVAAAVAGKLAGEKKNKSVTDGEDDNTK